MKRFLLFVGSLLIVSSMMAQNVDFSAGNFPDSVKKEFKTALKNKKLGESSLKGGDYRSALTFLLKAYDFNRNNAQLDYEIATCYAQLGQRTLASQYAEEAYALNPSVADDILYYKGLACQQRYEFSEAVNYYNQYLSSSKVSPEGDRKARQRIEECENGKKLMQREIPCTIHLLDTHVNCIYDDYGPAVTADDSLLFFTSRREGKKRGRRNFASDGKYPEKIYRSSRGTSVEWDSAHLTLGANMRGHMAIQGVSNDGQKVILYKERRGGNLYESKLKGTSFGAAKRLPKCVNTKYHETSASYSYDGNTIYFCSDRPDMGFGGHDIYKVTKNDKGKWKVVENLGNVINTPDDEMTVFMHPDNQTLYFSSRGHKGMGGFDIYVATLTNGKWTEPRNLGTPINTPNDEISFVITANGQNAYFASSQAGGAGEEDIYCISFKSDKVFVTSTEDNLLDDGDSYKDESEYSDRRMSEPKMLLLTGIVRDKSTGNPLAASIELYDLDSNKEIGAFESNSESGKFLMSLPSGKNYRIKVASVGYNGYEEDFNVTDTNGFQSKDLLVELEGSGEAMPVGLDVILFDFDKSNLKGSEAAASLDKVVEYLKAYPKVSVKVCGHTDDMGTKEYNQALSERRAQTAIDYIAEKGIDRKRMTKVGYGATRPVATNETKEGRALNRRVEFVIDK